MTSTHPSERERRIRGRDELIQAIPYLLEYHPVESLVLVGMAGGRLVVTARTDLADVDLGGELLLYDTVSAAVRGGARDFVAVVFTERDDPPPAPGGTGCHAGVEVAWAVDDAVAACGGSLTDAVLVRSGRCWSYMCESPCCPPDGTPLSAVPSPFVAQATVEGTVVLPDRAARTATIDPLPADERAQLLRPLADAENDARAAHEAGARQRHERSAKRALFAALRAGQEPGWTPPPAAQLARLAVALTTKATRDSIWYAIEDGRLDGRPLLAELARRCPTPYDVEPVFLYGWACWRAGNTMLAGHAAQLALASDPGSFAAQTLHAAVLNCLDPHSVARMRPPRGGRRR